KKSDVLVFYWLTPQRVGPTRWSGWTDDRDRIDIYKGLAKGWCRARALGLSEVLQIFFLFASSIAYHLPVSGTKMARLQDPILEPAPSPWLLVLPHSPLDSYTEALSSSISSEPILHGVSDMVGMNPRHLSAINNLTSI
ncbi:hypothetical protein Prudu_021747, partial [Prunus dulcis]